MRDISSRNFGLIIAYLLPGFTTLWGIGQFSTTVQNWFAIQTDLAPTVAGFLYVTIASLGTGVIVNTFRRHTLDKIHHLTGVQRANWKYSILQENLTAVEFVIANQFRFHQFHGNMLIALIVSFVSWEMTQSAWQWPNWVVFVLIELLLWFGSRDNLRNYYLRLEDILGPKN